MVLPAIGTQTQYDPIADFTPLVKLFEYVTVLATTPNFPVRNVRELIEHSKKNPKEVFYGTPGPATSFHILGELFNKAAETTMTHVPYKGGSEQTTGLIAGQTQVSFLVLQNVLPFLKDGRIRVISNLADSRHPAIPDVPLMREEFPALKTNLGWMGIFGPAKLPSAVSSRLAKAFQATILNKEVREKLQDNGLLAIGHIYQPGEFANLVRTEHEKIKSITSSLNIKAN